MSSELLESNHYLTAFWTSSLQWNHWPLRYFLSLGIDGSPAVPHQDCMVDLRLFHSSMFSIPSHLQYTLGGRAFSLKNPVVNNPGIFFWIASLILFRVSWPAGAFVVETQVSNQPIELHRQPRKQWSALFLETALSWTFFTRVRLLSGKKFSLALWGEVEDPRLISCNHSA